jgi:flagellar FliL protein
MAMLGHAPLLGMTSVKALIVLLLAISLPFSALAQEKKEEKEGENAAPKIIYVGIVPALVGNYSSGMKMKFYKADISLKVTGSEAEEKVKYHEPLIRNQLVQLFSQQTDESLGTQDAKEKLRQEALKQVKQVLEQEEGKPYVEDLLFNNLILQ